jgi:hypothetical protein
LSIAPTVWWIESMTAGNPSWSPVKPMTSVAMVIGGAQRSKLAFDERPDHVESHASGVVNPTSFCEAIEPRQRR